MSTGKNRNRGPGAPSPEPIPPAGHLSAWPSDFKSPRETALVMFCLAGWTLIMAKFALGNNLQGLKQALMIVAGARLEPLLALDSMHSMDIAAVLYGFIVVATLGYIHVSLGLAALLAVRPWLDGFVYEGDNTYFLWATLYLLVLWAIRHLRDPKPIRGAVPLGLLAVYGGFGVLSALTTIQYNTTYQELLYWACYWVVLFLAINSTRGRAARNVLFVGFFSGMAGQALYAYPYLGYVLPWMRNFMAEDPRRLAEYFPGITEFTPEVARRMNLNRSSASMVFPNALAALLILGIPGCFALAVDGWRGRRKSDPTPMTRFRYIVPWSLPLFLVVCLPLYTLGQLALNYRLEGPPWFGNQGNLILLCVATAALVIMVFLFTSRKMGLQFSGRVLALVATALLFPVMLGALWITYSRGAMLALILAGAGCALVFSDTPRRWLTMLKAGRHLRTAAPVLMLTLMIVVAMLSMALGGPAVAQGDTAAIPPGAEVTDEGIDVGLGELVSPASFRLRIGYWRVALSMAWQNCWTGVGPGNFKYAYPAYQQLNAGDVQNAHNGILQAWCEVGLPGALVLLAFWLYVFIRAIRDGHAATDASRKWRIMGLFCGLLAFVLHALLDINFSHPSLMTFAMVAAGLLIRAGLSELSGGGSTTHGWIIAVPLLLAAPLLAGMAARPYLQQLGSNGGAFINVDNRSMLDTRFSTANFFLAESTEWARGGKEGAPPVLPIKDVVVLHADRSNIFTLGRVFAPDPVSGKMVQVSSEAGIPPNAVFQIMQPWNAHRITFDIVLAWVAELKRLDARFPHVPENAMLLSRVCKLMVEQTTLHQEAQRDENLAQMIYWAEEAVRRSPDHKDMYQNLAWAHWCAGTNTSGQPSLDHFEQGLEAFERSRALAPYEPDYYYAHAHALAAMGQAYRNGGDPEKGDALIRQSQDVDAQGRTIQQQRSQLGLH